ncbi:MAG: hypothetical protein AB1324_04855, partial [Candidatus Micrarchaeota archaeon]
EHIDKRFMVSDLRRLVERARAGEDEGYLGAVALAGQILKEHRGDSRIIAEAFGVIRAMPMEDRMLLVKREYEARMCELVGELSDRVSELEAKLRPSRIGFGNF